MAPGDGPPPDWSRYDEVAEPYERFVAVNAYAALARDLVAALTPPPGGCVLDAGCGTGGGLLAAQDAVGARGVVVGLDVSLAMLRRAATRSAAPLVVGAVPGLPFPDRRFDGVAASLVLSHCDSYEAALCDMVRVLKHGGRIGVTAGAQNPNRPNPAYQAWVATAESFVGPQALREAARRVIPWEAWLTDPAHVATALEGAGLEGVEVSRREYPVTMATDDYLEMFDLFLYGRFVRRSLGPARWREFRESVAGKLHAEGVKRVDYTARYHLGVGRKP